MYQYIQDYNCTEQVSLSGNSNVHLDKYNECICDRNVICGAVENKMHLFNGSYILFI